MTFSHDFQVDCENRSFIVDFEYGYRDSRLTLHFFRVYSDDYKIEYYPHELDEHNERDVIKATIREYLEKEEVFNLDKYKQAEIDHKGDQLYDSWKDSQVESQD